MVDAKDGSNIEDNAVGCDKHIHECGSVAGINLLLLVLRENKVVRKVGRVGDGIVDCHLDR
jgi:hypothetical protein